MSRRSFFASFSVALPVTGVSAYPTQAQSLPDLVISRMGILPAPP